MSSGSPESESPECKLKTSDEEKRIRRRIFRAEAEGETPYSPLGSAPGPCAIQTESVLRDLMSRHMKWMIKQVDQPR